VSRLRPSRQIRPRADPRLAVERLHSVFSLDFRAASYRVSLVAISMQRPQNSETSHIRAAGLPRRDWGYCSEGRERLSGNERAGKQESVYLGKRSKSDASFVEAGPDASEARCLLLTFRSLWQRKNAAEVFRVRRLQVL